MAVQQVKIRKPYERRERVGFDTGDDSRAKQSFKDESDINNIMAQYMRTGVITHMKENEGQYIDLPEGVDYQSALNMVIAAGEAFDSLPGSVRQRFQNNAVEFLDFMDDPDNIEESVELGLREREAPVIEPILDPPASPPEEPAVPPE